MKKRGLIILALLTGTLLVGCSQKQEVTNENPEVTNKPSPIVTNIPTITTAPDDKSTQPAKGAEFIGKTPLGVTIYEGSTEENSLEYIYITSTEGWKAERNAEGMFKESITLYKTEDGGTNWDKLTGTEDEKATIPLESKTGIIFTNSNDGWITTQIPQDGYIGLFRTMDGGVTWKQQELIIPDEYMTSQFTTYPPVFFTAQDGLLLCYAFDDEPKQLVYVTHDGGATWIQTDEKGDNIFQWSYTEQEDIGGAGGWSITYENKSWTTSDALIWNEGSIN